jgi:hypothetical protein
MAHVRHNQEKHWTYAHQNVPLLMAELIGPSNSDTEVTLKELISS